MTASQTSVMTAEELLRLGDIGRCELTYGELRMMSPAGAPHGVVAARLARHLDEFFDVHDLGVVFGVKTGFVIERDPDLVRAPDASFVAKARIAGGLQRGFFEGVPDLAVEVVSPDDTKREVAEKVNMWLANGCRSCWIADPQKKTVVVQYPDGRRVSFAEQDALVDETLPGFSLALARLFRLL